MNLANKLTLLRILLIPVFLILMSVNLPYNVYLATGVFVLAALTDKLDGYIARTRNQVTNLGKFMDPLADKLLVAAALISLTELQRLSTWVVVIIIAREFAITGLRAIAAAEGVVIAASWWGKLKTTAQMIAIVAVLLSIPYNEVLVWIAAIVTILSGIDYIYKNKNVFRSKSV